MGCRELDEKPSLKGLDSRRYFSVGVRGGLDSQTFWLAYRGFVMLLPSSSIVQVSIQFSESYQFFRM